MNYNISQAVQFNTPVFKLYFEGACWRADSLGYRVEEFYSDDHEMSAGRLSEILLARGVQGVLVAPQLQPNTQLDMRWEWFSSVTFGFSLAKPQLHLVSSTQYRIAMAVTRKLYGLGYQRVGFLASESFDERTDRNFTAGFHVASMGVPRSRRIPPLLIRHEETPAVMEARLRAFVARWRVDALVSVSRMHPIITDSGLRVPDDLAVALLGHDEEDPFFAGMDEQGFHTGAAAVDLVVGMIHRGERGVPEVPHRLLIEGRWIDGASAPPVTRKRVGGRKQTAGANVADARS